MIALRFDFEAPNRQTTVFFLTSNNALNWRSGFPALVFLVVINGPGGIRLLSVNSSGLETIYASVMALYCCLSSRLPVYLYNFLIFSRHVCLYKGLLLNNWSISMVTIFYFSQSDCNNPFIMTHFYPNDLTSSIKSVSLVNAFYLPYCAEWEDFPSIWKQIYSFQYGDSFYFAVEVEELIWLRR